MSKIKMLIDSVSGEPTSWFIDGHVLAVSSHGGRADGAVWGPFYKDTNLIQSSTLKTKSPLKGPTSKYCLDWELGFNI